MDVIRVGGILLTGPHQAFGIEPKIYIVGSALLGLFKTFFFNCINYTVHRVE